MNPSGHLEPSVPISKTRFTTRLGFGCNSLFGPRSRSEALAILGAAYDAGIRHFDVARAYSSGDAEGLLGEFLVGKRDQVTITTKFGLQPAASGVARLKWAKSLARKVMRLSPGLRSALGKTARQATQAGAFSPEQTRASLETSLRELKTDRVDLFLLHEGDAPDCSPELHSFLEDASQEGKIGRFGIGSNFERIQRVATERAEFARILQFENSVLRRNLKTLPADPTRFTITHGAIGGSFTEIRDRFRSNPQREREISHQLQIDLSNPGILASLMLAAAVRENGGGIVLFSSTRPDVIRQNVKAIADEQFSADQVDRFRTLIGERAGTAS